MRAVAPQARSQAHALGLLSLSLLCLLAGCGTEVVELASVDSGATPADSGVDSGILPPTDTGVFDLGFPDLGFVDGGGDAGPDSGVDTGVVDTGVTEVSCVCRLRCSTNPECEGIDPSSTCTSGYCTVLPASPGCTTDADCLARSTCMTVTDPITGCP